MVAAAAAGCRRVIFASSIHAVSGYAADTQVHPDDPVSPGDLYGVSKCFGEAMARFMATQHNLSAIAIRIGAFQPLEAAQDPDSMGMMTAFVSHRDLDQLIRRCIDDDRLRFAIVHGLSQNRFNRMDIETARELLGYRPEDDFTQENPNLSGLDLSDKVHPHSEQGGQRSGIRNDLKSAAQDNS
jgi:nucleoside-diphosphate-sugar epimerase